MGGPSSLWSLLRLAGPLAIADVATMFGGVATTMMLGRIGADAVGVQGLSGVLFYNVAVFGLDLMLGLDYPIAYAVGSGRFADATRYLAQGCWLAIALAGLLTAVLWWVPPLLAAFDLDPALLSAVVRYLRTSSLGLLPLLLWVACRRYLQARGQVRAVMVTLLAALGLELFAKWTLIFGHLGAPALGVQGAALGALLEFSWLGIAGLWLVSRTAGDGIPSERLPLSMDWTLIREVVRRGLPAATRTALEVGVFAAATTMAARIGAVPLAAHQITLNLASLAFMVPLGLSAGTAVQVGNALGAGRPDVARRAGWTGIATGAAFMMAAAAVFTVAPTLLLRLYTADPAVIAVGVPLLLCAAAFQLFDGVQVVATGALRGSGDTRTPLVLNLIAHWGIGLPLGWWLCFRSGMGVIGLWLGVTLGLMLVGTALVWVWARRVRGFAKNR